MNLSDSASLPFRWLQEELGSGICLSPVWCTAPLLLALWLTFLKVFAISQNFHYFSSYCFIVLYEEAKEADLSCGSGMSAAAFYWPFHNGLRASWQKLQSQGKSATFLGTWYRACAYIPLDVCDLAIRVLLNHFAGSLGRKPEAEEQFQQRLGANPTLQAAPSLLGSYTDKMYFLLICVYIFSLLGTRCHLSPLSNTLQVLKGLKFSSESLCDA